MNHWSKSAQDALEEHLRAYRASLPSGDGLDADEVVADLRRHVEEELPDDLFPIVTAEQVRQVLQRMGPAPEPEQTRKAPAARVEASDWNPNRERARLMPFAFFFGVLLPVITLLFELSTHFSGGVFFDPIPTFWHVAAVALVPVCGALVWRHVRRPERPLSRGLLVASGAALFVAVCYSLLYLTLMPFAFVAVIYFGLGLLPLTPFLSALALHRLLNGARLQRGMEGAAFWNPVWSGMALGLVAFFLINARPWLTLHWTAQAARAETVEAARAPLQWLRCVGDEQILLAECYSAGGRRMNDLWTVESLKPRIKEEDARKIYFQVTGLPFNAVPPPQLGSAARRWDFLEDWEWDSAHGGTAVAGKIKGLTLQQSRLDGLADPAEGWAYLEWIMEFKNASSVDREARAQIQLPPGGVVSRLTLWVNGEEREAAFAGAAEVRKAYTDVAVVQRRDPVLVTSAGNDRVLMQCFPVPPQGGTMKIRMGLTIPWTLVSSNQSALRLPHIAEHNFGIPESTQHSVWIEAPGGVEFSSGLLEMTDSAKPGRKSLRGSISEARLGGSEALVRVPVQPASVWARDHRTEDGAVVHQSIVARAVETPKRVVLVLDGAGQMAAHRAEIAEAVAALPDGVELAVLLAKDGVEELLIPTKLTAEVRTDLARRLRRVNTAGGQDNQAALLRAVELANGGGTIVWVHGPQPVALDQSEKLDQQRLWNGGAMPVIHDLQTGPGPNRAAEQPHFRSLLETVPRIGGVRADLERLFQQWQPGARTFAYQRERFAAPPATAPQEIKGSSHVVRLWAENAVREQAKQRQRADAVATAARYQLVTPVSGAVVLETVEQFKRAGLEPVAESTVPTIPEPSTGLLLLLGGGALLLRKRRR